MSTEISCKKIAEGLLQDMREKRRKMKPVCVAAILIGGNQASLSFLKQKQKAAQELNINFKLAILKSNSFKILKKNIKAICVSPENSGVIIQLPLPENLTQEQKQELLNLIPLEKDIDALSDDAFNQFMKNGFPTPPSVETVKIILYHLKIKPEENKFAVFGARGKLVGLPVSLWLAQNGYKFYPIELKTASPEKISRKADIIISAIGKPGYINKKFIRKGAILIDFGYGIKNGKISGDVDIESIKNKACAYTPTPGGTGPVLVSALLRNLIQNAIIK